MKELIIDEHGNDKKIMYVEDEKIIERYEENEQNHTIEGNIYIGKVQNVLSGLQAAFIDLGNGKNAFIPNTEMMLSDSYYNVKKISYEYKNSKN